MLALCQCRFTGDRHDRLSLEAAMELRDQIKPQRGDYAIDLLPGLTIHVAPTEIRNQDGEVIDIIG